jgi:hypothetical protein
MLNFATGSKDVKNIEEICRRWEKLHKKIGGDRFDFMSAHMDISACHASGTPLRLEDLLTAQEFDFAHDVLGIRDNIDRTTGALGNHFSPRFSVKK